MIAVICRHAYFHRTMNGAIQHVKLRSKRNWDMWKIDKETIEVPPCISATLDLEMISPSLGFARADRPNDLIVCGALRFQRQGTNETLARIVFMLDTVTPFRVPSLCVMPRRRN